MISLPNILKKFTKPEAAPYQFPDAESLGTVTEVSDASLETFDLEVEAEGFDEISAAPPPPPAKTPQDFAQVQAEAILEDARQQAAQLLQQAKDEAEEALEELRAQAQQDGYQHGYAEGMSHAMTEGQQQRAEQSIVLGAEVQHFLEKAALVQDELLSQHQNELRDLAIAVAEKVIKVSLKSSGDIVSRLIQNATEKMKKKEWVHIYIAGCDAKSIAQTAPQLTEALSFLSDHVKIVPISDDESGTCIIETPDEIIDASTSTQLSNIRDLLVSGS